MKSRRVVTHRSCPLPVAAAAAAVVEVAEWPEEAPEARAGEEEAVAAFQGSQSPEEEAVEEAAKDARTGCHSEGFRYCSAA